MNRKPPQKLTLLQGTSPKSSDPSFTRSPWRRSAFWTNSTLSSAKSTRRFTRQGCQCSPASCTTSASPSHPSAPPCTAPRGGSRNLTRPSSRSIQGMVSDTRVIEHCGIEWLWADFSQIQGTSFKSIIWMVKK